MTKYQVNREYTDAPSSPISVLKGETLQFIEESDPNGDWPNWIFCKGKEKQGWVPKQILAFEEGHNVTLLKDYNAREHTLSVGEVIISLYELNGWIWSHKLDIPNEQAWAPLNHLSQL